MSLPPLPQQILAVDARQAALTERHLAGPADGLTGYFLALRAEADAALAPRLPPAGAEPYPYGRCEEITREVGARLARRLARPAHPVERAICAFVAEGGRAGSVWGVLRGTCFQNALQIGGLYVDVSNDTVVASKPKVEILPMAESGLVNVRDLAHFREIATLYWGARIYANHLAPGLAPLLPMVSYSPGRLVPGLQSACDYMIALMCRDGFRQAEDWLGGGPSPPAEVAEAIMQTVPPDLRPRTADARGEALAACRRARAAGHGADGPWRNARVMDYLRIARSAPGTPLPEPPPTAAGPASIPD